jgi:hypothetical protein
MCDHSAIVVLSEQRLTLDRSKLMCDGTVTQMNEAISPTATGRPKLRVRPAAPAAAKILTRKEVWFQAQAHVSPPRETLRQ